MTTDKHVSSRARIIHYFRQRHATPVENNSAGADQWSRGVAREVCEGKHYVRKTETWALSPGRVY